jgi:hypothetical protein
MKLYKPVSLSLCIVFALVGLLFLSIPDRVLAFFNALSSSWGMPLMPVEGLGFYPLLAVGYMYLVTVLAFLMYRHPEDRRFPLLLIHAKLATAILSLALFLAAGWYLIYITNFVLDGCIAMMVLAFTLHRKKPAS